MDLLELPGKFDQARDDALCCYREAEYRADLAEKDAHGDAVQESYKDRLRQEVGDGPQLQETSTDSKDAGQESERNG